MPKKLIKRIGIMVVFAILAVQLFPMHLHQHNHFHQNNNQHIGSEIKFNNFEGDASEHHSHATVIELNNNLILQNNSHDFNIDLTVILAFLIAFLILLVFKFFDRQYSQFLPKKHYFFFIPALRAPPVNQA